MKVWVLEAFSAEEYSADCWIHGVFSSREAAEEEIKALGPQPIDEDQDNHDEGFYLCDPKEYPVQ
jgi:hypothetical protein